MARSRAPGRSGGKGKYRSARTGRYVTRKHAKRSPRTTLKESTSKGSARKSSRGIRYRSAITGHYVTAATARRHPDTTVTERS